MHLKRNFAAAGKSGCRRKVLHLRISPQYCIDPGLVAFARTAKKIERAAYQTDSQPNGQGLRRHRAPYPGFSCPQQTFHQYRRMTILASNFNNIDFDQARNKSPAHPMDFDLIHKALANPARRQILEWLKTPLEYFGDQEHPLDWGVCAGLINHRAELSQSTVSAHLATLQRAELITARRVGQWIFYSRNEAAIAAFLEHVNGTL